MRTRSFSRTQVSAWYNVCVDTGESGISSRRTIINESHDCVNFYSIVKFSDKSFIALTAGLRRATIRSAKDAKEIKKKVKVIRSAAELSTEAKPILGAIQQLQLQQQQQLQQLQQQLSSIQQQLYDGQAKQGCCTII